LSQGGDAAWEGLRVYEGRVFMLDKHLSRLAASAKALDFRNVHNKARQRTAKKSLDLCSG
jgi:branched-subunit amino acid aminotransferase/4-amino-4-deoxychorismate lyase